MNNLNQQNLANPPVVNIPTPGKALPPNTLNPLNTPLPFKTPLNQLK